jgi:hypothetical protein
MRATMFCKSTVPLENSSAIVWRAGTQYQVYHDTVYNQIYLDDACACRLPIL